MARTRKPKASSAPRVDGYRSAITGLGIDGYDKRNTHVFYADSRRTQQENEELWRGHDLAARIVESLPDDVFRKGFCVSVPEDKDTSEAIDAHMQERDCSRVLTDAYKRMRALGGCGILVGAVDGATDLRKPLNEERISTVKYLNLLTPQELRARDYYRDPLAPKYGEPEIYDVQPRVGGGMVMPVHESRVIAFRGPIVSYQAQQDTQGWGDSVFVRCAAELRDFQVVWDAVGALMNELGMPVWSVKGLAEILGSNDPETFRALVRDFQYARSTLRAAVVDADGGGYERKGLPLAQVPEILQQRALRLAASVPMPVTKLMGENPGGLNATGKVGQDDWDDYVQAGQRAVTPQVERLCRLMMLAKDGPTGGKEPDNWAVTWHPLRQPTEAEKADVRAKIAQADVAYINAGVLAPEEVAVSRFGGDEYSIETHLDMEARKKMETAQEQAPAPNGAANGQVPPEDEPGQMPPRAMQ